jgi:hypothetical protein
MPGLLGVERPVRIPPRRPGGGKARATITFAVVNATCPFGKPGGIA